MQDGGNMTLIELYDERPLENVLGVEVFCPSRVVYVCPERVSSDPGHVRKLEAYFAHRKLDIPIHFFYTSVYDAAKVVELLRKIVTQYQECAIDITGGTDAVLFAAGMLCSEKEIPVFTYSRRKNAFYNIKDAAFADALPCTVTYTVEDCFRMAGGAMRTGRVENEKLKAYHSFIEPFFAVYLKYRTQWTNIVTYIQKISMTKNDEPASMTAMGEFAVKGERGSKIIAPEEALKALERIRLIQGLRFEAKRTVSFQFYDAQVRMWLRDVGSVLELYVYKACLDTGLFDDVRLSAVVDWEGQGEKDAVTNELDVMCTRGVVPYFFSCKTCEIHTEALNELAILRDRFGGEIAKAAIVTAETANAAMRNRAAELDIIVIDLDDLTSERIKERIIQMV